MAWLDGAVNGMVSRLIPAGFTPDEAFCLAQAAYIKESKRAKGVPRSVLERQQVSLEINQALKRLGSFPMGPEAHRQRIILWEKVFGRGSWHEPIDPEEIYGPAGEMARSIMESLRLQKMADDAAFSKLYYVAPDAGATPLDLLKRGFQVMAGGNSLLCAFKIRGNTDQYDGLVACTGDRLGLFTVQSLATSGDPMPGDRIREFSSIRAVAYATIPGRVTIPDLEHFRAADAPHPVMMISFDNEEVWDLRFSTDPGVGNGYVPYENFVKGFHDEYQKWHVVNKQVERPTIENVQQGTAEMSMSTARSGHTATLLLNGQVLVAGGDGESVLSNAELYDPSTGQWQNAATMHAARTDHTATLLPDGTVLIAGGKDDNYAPLAIAERYDTETGTWVATSIMATARESHTATLLHDGSILIAGGYSDYKTSDTAELFDPATGDWSTIESMRSPRYGHSATLLPSGSVLVCGGQNGDDWLDSCELYDPANRTWSTTTAMSGEHAHHTATLLANDTVLIAGGATGGVELYDPESEAWSKTASMGASRSGHSATLLPDGTVLVIGGTTPKTLGQPHSDYGVGSTEIYDPVFEAWAPAAGKAALRLNHTATLLADGTVMTCGGYNWRAQLASVEFWR